MPNKLILDIFIGDKLKYYRKQKHLTQMEVVRAANLLGSMMSESTYAKIEQGARNIFLSDFVILKIVLEFSYDELFRDIEETILKKRTS